MIELPENLQGHANGIMRKTKIFSQTKGLSWKTSQENKAICRLKHRQCMLIKKTSITLTELNDSC